MSESVSVVCFRSACSMQSWSIWVSQWVLYVSDLPALCGGGADEWVSECCMFQICLLYVEVEQMSESVSVVCFRSACSMRRWSRWVSQWVLCVSDPPALCGGGASWVSQWVLYVSDPPALCGGGADEWVSECCMFKIRLLYAEVEQMSESVSVVCFRSACSMQSWSIMSESVSVVCFRSACSMQRWSIWVSQWVLYVSDLLALCGGGADEWVSECCVFQICLLYAEVEQMSESVSVVCFRSACSMRRWSRWVSQWVLYVSDLPALCRVGASWVSQWVLCVSDLLALCGGGADEWVSECCMFQICLLYAEVEQMSESVSVVCFRSACSMWR